MQIKWIGSPQHTDWGLVRTGDVIDTAARGIPAEVVSSWTRDEYAVKVNPQKTADKNGKEK